MLCVFPISRWDGGAQRTESLEMCTRGSELGARANLADGPVDGTGSYRAHAGGTRPRPKVRITNCESIQVSDWLSWASRQHDPGTYHISPPTWDVLLSFAVSLPSGYRAYLGKGGGPAFPKQEMSPPRVPTLWMNSRLGCKRLDSRAPGPQEDPGWASGGGGGETKRAADLSVSASGLAAAVRSIGRGLWATTSEQLPRRQIACGSLSETNSGLLRRAGARQRPRVGSP